MTKLIYNALELSQVLAMPLGTMRQYATKKPEALPPRTKLPTRKLLWSVADVEAWVHANRGSPEPREDSSGV